MRCREPGVKQQFHPNVSFPEVAESRENMQPEGEARPPDSLHRRSPCELTKTDACFKPARRGDLVPPGQHAVQQLPSGSWRRWDFRVQSFRFYGSRDLGAAAHRWPGGAPACCGPASGPS